ncbi:hypothetical protein [Nocardia seriolae]|uniref:hypothetical protein n=1 Tax=Nocardia seriolae TaxID=37332 RepID=UPI000909B440|nr:hypothetical protein [Nocardia seriolae]MTJ61718.1 hypothetical protein [Nocardia seriolae]MTJ76412.1 hypothetical protein [Nocardia seriolae]MTJ86728.1 hypothetical protein [Nocardia seriolae]MTK30723.1 hypothetical protein [Nocardia seriolae]MTK39687.1 hypothetical protein [Nocardia seriolae]
MSVDMFEYRFVQELRKLKEFRPNDVRDPRVWPSVGSDDGKLPAWRALFTAMCHYGHSTGYRLFELEDFYNYCRRAYSEKNPKRQKYKKYFSGELQSGMRQRVGVWYESGMAETYLYSCLAEAIEDEMKVGVVLYDARADWKLKADLVVIMNDTPMRVSAYVGEDQERPSIEARREGIERERKKNTSQSAHWNNTQLERMRLFEIQRTDDDLQIVNGVRLFSISAVNRLLVEMYKHACVEDGWLFPEESNRRQ